MATKQFVFLSAICRKQAGRALRVDEDDHCESVALSVDQDGILSATPVPSPSLPEGNGAPRRGASQPVDDRSQAVPRESSLPADNRSAETGRGQPTVGLPSFVGYLRRQRMRGEPTWFFAPGTADVALNGVSPPLPLVNLSPGDVLTVGDHSWLAMGHWSPRPEPAPPELSGKPCPVCGLTLGEAPVVRCPCGRWMHLERPEQPDDRDALNCYLTSQTCGACRRPARLEAQWIPDVPEVLFERPGEDESM